VNALRAEVNTTGQNSRFPADPPAVSLRSLFANTIPVNPGGERAGSGPGQPWHESDKSLRGPKAGQSPRIARTEPA
jgi:hypothetical protein